MRLINYGVGEIVDRLTILSLKILHGTATGQSTGHFENERAALITQVLSRTTINGAWFEHAMTLGAVNGAIWTAEDDLRELRRLHDLNQGHGDVGSVAFRMQQLNDQRAGLIETINKLTGDHLGSEKINAG